MRIISTKPVRLGNNQTKFIGNFADVGKEWQGQYKKTKQHRGQLIYFDHKDIPRVATVYANQSKELVISGLDKDGYELYSDGKVFNSSMWVHINMFKRIKSEETYYPSGQYQIKSIRSDGSVMLADANGEPIPTNITQLVSSDMN